MSQTRLMTVGRKACYKMNKWLTLQCFTFSKEHKLLGNLDICLSSNFVGKTMATSKLAHIHLSLIIILIDAECDHFH